MLFASTAMMKNILKLPIFKIAVILSIPILIQLLSFSYAAAQSSSMRWSEDELDRADTARDVTYLNSEEKKLIFYMNLARIDGEKFFNTYFQDFTQVYNLEMKQYRNYEELKVNRKDKYYRGLEKDLKGVKNLPLFEPDETLTWVAQQHAKDLRKSNTAGHQSSDGRSLFDRIKPYYPTRAMGENLAFGFSKGLANICMLLLDKNVSDLGHRKTILGTTNKLRYVGVTIDKHPEYRYVAVMDFISAAKD